jgi:hypothetical protein
MLSVNLRARPCARHATFIGVPQTLACGQLQNRSSLMGRTFLSVKLAAVFGLLVAVVVVAHPAVDLEVVPAASVVEASAPLCGEKAADSASRADRGSGVKQAPRNVRQTAA